MHRYLFNFYLAIEGINANKLRTFLTALGIIFGVAAVIAMLAIGSGAKQAILEQMKLIGTNNIVLTAKMPGDDNEEEEEAAAADAGPGGAQNDKKPFSPGLTLEDLASLQKVIPNIESTSPEIVLPTNVIQSAQLQKARCIGVNNNFFDLNQLNLDAGDYFHQSHLEGGKPVCIIGKNIQIKFFKDGNAIGQQIKCGNTWLRVIGVLQKRQASKESLENLGIRDYNSDVYVPVTTSLLRFKNRAKITQAKLARRNRRNTGEQENYHQLDRAVIRVADSKQMKATAAVMSRILKRRHNDIIDFEIEVPELLLEQEQKTQDTFNLVLAVIAAISLLVGGIGIMNIMLASVLERIKEIGVRRSLGATREDIILQFLFEAIIISLLGGLIGVGLGILSATAIASVAEIPTVISAWSIILSFGVAGSIGLIFGLFPARKAAMQDPIKALRSD